MKVLKGLPVCRGIAIGKIFRFSSEPLKEKTLLQQLSREFHDLDLKDIGRIKVLRDNFYQKISSKENIENQVKEFKQVLKQSKKDLVSARKKLSKDISEKFSEIIDFQILALKDSNIFNRTIDLIREYRISAYLAVSIIFNERIELLRKNNKKKFRNRTYDLVDLYNRLVSNLKTADTGRDETGVDIKDEDLILVSRRMFPTDLAKVDLKKVRGIVIEKQNIQSHTSILIRSLKIPYLIKIKQDVDEIIDGQRAILDGFNGKLIIQPDKAMDEKYKKYSKDSIKRIGSFKKKNKKLPDILASINTIEEARQASSMGVRGIGLFRTELSFLNGDIGLTVDDQFKAYSNILKLFSGKPVTLRTLDLSGDKQAFINLISKETLTASGARALIRKTCSAQMKALIKASKYGELILAFPMVSKAEKMASLKNQILSMQKKLAGSDPKVASPVRLGAFIETPAGVYALEDILDHTDTISIGTNDLLTLVYAGSRQSDRPYRSDDLLHPITIKLLCQIIEGCHKKNQKVTVCGGIAASPKFLPILVGMGADGISVELKRYREVLNHTNKMDPAKCEELVSAIRNMKTKKEIIDVLCSFGSGLIR